MRNLLTKFCLILSITSICAKQPHIVVIVADDYGWNDIGYHNKGEMKTPNLDELAAEGIKLENYYVQPICSPTRSQLLSGKYQIHTGLQHNVIEPCTPSGLPLEDKTIADRLKSVGYETHAIGKWHIGFYKKEYTPRYRGFDSFFGFLKGSGHYFNHSSCYKRYCGIDMQENETPTDQYRGQYSTNLFTSKATEVISNHDQTKPLFLYMAYQAVHGPLEVPERYIKEFEHIKDNKRKIYAAMVAAMDEGVRNITTKLKETGMWENTVLVFTTDNGGQTFKGGNNAPLRGNKYSYFEGGIRGVAFLSGKALPLKRIENRHLLHVSDWYPTLFNLGGGDSSLVKGLDGFDQWKTISENTTSKRTEILFNIDLYKRRKGSSASNIFDTSIQAALRLGDWKIITGDPGFDKWVPDPKGAIPFLFQDIFNSEVMMEPKPKKDRVSWLEQVYQHVKKAFRKLIQDEKGANKRREVTEKNVYLFNLANDPEERQELSKEYPHIVDKLLQRLAYYNSTQVPVNHPRMDKKCDPALHGGFWVPWQN